MHQILEYTKKEGPNSSILPKFIGVLWAIWRTRNDQVFRLIRASLEAIKRYIEERKEHHLIFVSDEKRPHPHYLNKGPQSGFINAKFSSPPHHNPDVLLRVDGAWDKSTHRAAVAWIAQIPDSQTHSSQAQILRASSALQAEAMTCLFALRWAHASFPSKVLLFTDFEMLVRLIGSTSL